MTNLTTRQNEYLKAMGIDVWLPKDALSVEEVEQVPLQAVVDVISPEPSALDPLSNTLPETISETTPIVKTVPLAEPVKLEDISTLDWNALQTRVAECQLCELHLSRTQTVFGVGNKQADWLILGDVSGTDKDCQGEPFVGEAGQLLTAMLKAIGLSRQQVYITNIFKCCPPSNINVKAEEAASCVQYLQRQIELVQPKIILALGSSAAQGLLQSNTTLSRLRGKVHHIETTSAPVIVTYHPTYLLSSPLEKRNAWEDLLFAVKTLDEQQV